MYENCDIVRGFGEANKAYFFYIFLMEKMPWEKNPSKTFVIPFMSKGVSLSHHPIQGVET